MSRKTLLTLVPFLLAIGAFAYLLFSRPTTATFAKVGSTVDISHFGLGQEFVKEDPELAKLYSEMGAQWAKILLENGEPETLLKLDAVIDSYRIARVTHFMMSLKLSPSLSSNEAEYSKFLKQVVARYSPKGVSLYEIEPRTKVEEYQHTLQLAYKTIKSVDKNAQIILGGVDLEDIFDDYPSTDTIAKRVTPKLASFTFMDQALGFGDAYDMAAFHFNSNYTGAYETASTIRAKLEKLHLSKPLWADDAISAPMLDGRFNPPIPAVISKEIYRCLSTVSLPCHEAAVTAYRMEQAKATVKKIVTAMELGLAGIMLGNEQDWVELPNNLNRGSFAFQGLVGPKHELRPAYCAYQQLSRRLAGSTKLSRLETSNNVHIYFFAGGKTNWSLAWSDNPVEVKIPVKGESVSVTSTVTKMKDPNCTETAKPHSLKDHSLALELDSTPKFIEFQ